MSLLITCENGGNQIPPRIAHAFQSDAADADLHSAKGSDLGAAAAARKLARLTDATLIACPYSRLVVDVNRSPQHRSLFSRYTKKLSPADRQQLLRTVYDPYRQRVQSAIKKQLQSYSYVIHIAVRSFPLQGKSGPRRTDVGLVYDPCREEELDFCLDWYEEMFDRLPWLRVRRNYPMRSRSDSLVKSLREQFSPDEYLGIEIHLNQAWSARRTRIRERSFLGIGQTLATILEIEPAVNVDAA